MVGAKRRQLLDSGGAVHGSVRMVREQAQKGAAEEKVGVVFCFLLSGWWHGLLRVDLLF